MNATPGDHSAKSGAANRSPEDIEHDIDRTRENLDRTLGALEARLSVRRRLNAAADSARASGARWMRTGIDAATPDITTMIRMDHTHVLALFRRFKPHTPAGKKRALVSNACLALEIHAQLEEEIFYPALRRAGIDGDVLEKSVPEHDEMRQFIGVLRTMSPSDPNRDETFRALIRAVLHHVADEETTLLPQAEQLLADQLGVLGLQMTKRRIELLKPHLAEVAITGARSFPVATAVAVGGLFTLAWLLLRDNRPTRLS